MAKVGRGQQRSVDLIPDDVKATLDAYLRDKKLSQIEATRRTNMILEELGHPVRLTKSAVNRYSQDMEEVGAQLRESREVAQQWIGALGSVPQDDVGLLVVEIIRSLSFDITMMVRKGKIDADKVPEIVKTLNTMALTQMRIEKATSDNVKRAREIRKLAIEEVSEVIEKTAVQQGMNAEQAAFWRNKVLGVQ
ncbi:MAG: hypothetical protein A2075_12150 [Geobacteraceae bacterium GWC2_58_44]|nr:MAG: hypothetical protein A2075_12150 [Geobacteraceae bacterium GWC2_58_44]HBG06314.1 hypothetical protein [Geobacter sp.]